MQLTARHFMVALPLAFALHGAIAAAIFWTPERPGARGPGMGGIEVSLGPAGAALGEVAPPVPDAPEVPPEHVDEAVTASAPMGADPAPPEQTPPPKETTASTPPEAMPQEAVSQQAALQEVAARTVAPPPPPRPDHTPKMRKTRKSAAATPAVSGAGGRAGKETRGDAGSGKDRSGGGNPGAADYTARLLAWLQRHKRYPREAMTRRDQGTALLYFEIGPRGQVLSYRLRRSSGHEALDQEALALIRRAQPLPAPPPNLNGSRLRLVVPVRFSLR
jgi:protein TonB